MQKYQSRISIITRPEETPDEEPADAEKSNGLYDFEDRFSCTHLPSASRARLPLSSSASV